MNLKVDNSNGCLQTVPHEIKSISTKREENSLFEHLSLLLAKGEISFNDYLLMRDMLLCGDIEVEDALCSDMDDILNSDYLYHNTDFSYLDTLGHLTSSAYDNDWPNYMNTNSNDFPYDDNNNLFNSLNEDTFYNPPSNSFISENRCIFSSSYSNQSSIVTEKEPLLSCNSSSTLCDCQSDSYPYYTPDLFNSSFDYDNCANSVPGEDSFYSNELKWNPSTIYYMDNESDNYPSFSLSLSSEIVDTSTLTLKGSPTCQTTLSLSNPVKNKNNKKSIQSDIKFSASKRISNKGISKPKQKLWYKKVKYENRKTFADTRLRIKGRFLKKGDELCLRELVNLV